VAVRVTLSATTAAVAAAVAAEARRKSRRFNVEDMGTPSASIEYAIGQRRAPLILPADIETSSPVSACASRSAPQSAPRPGERCFLNVEPA
jgi:hypothetical protein